MPDRRSSAGFGLSERLRTALRDRSRRIGRLPGGDPFEAGDELLLAERFVKEAESTRGESLSTRLRLGKGGDEYDWKGITQNTQTFLQLDAAQARHV